MQWASSLPVNEAVVGGGGYWAVHHQHSSFNLRINLENLSAFSGLRVSAVFSAAITSALFCPCLTLPPYNPRGRRLGRVKWLITPLSSGTLGVLLRTLRQSQSWLPRQPGGTGNLRFQVVNSVLTWKMPLVLYWNRHADYVTASNTFPPVGEFWLTFYGPYYSWK